MDYFNYFALKLAEAEVLVGTLVFVVNSFLGLLIFLKNPKSWTNRFFFFLVLVLNIYIVVNYLSLHSSGPENQFFWIKIVMFTASFMGPLLFMLASTFPQDKISLPTPYLTAVFILAFLSAVFALTGYVFESLTYVNSRPLPVPGSGMPLFFINFVGLIAASFVVLILRYRYLGPEEKAKERYFLLGIVGSFTLITLVTIVSVVILKNSNLVVLGPIFSIVMVAPIAYAIVKYQLFNIKIIATNLLLIVIWIILGSKLIVSSSIAGFIIDALILFLMIVFGILLIKSVRKEVEQREKLEVLTKELETANKKLKELDRLKSEFLSFASHQVKTPLAAIKGFATLIYDGTYGQVPEKAAEAAHKIKESADRMIQLVTDFLNVRRIEEGKMEYKFEKVDAVRLIVSIFEELKPLAGSKNLDFDLELPSDEVIINVDSQTIRQVFQNLIENAIKYTNSGFVKIKLESKDGNFVFSVSDSGHGVSKELLPHLFEEFRRGGKEKQIEGTGLGLFIAHSIVEAHHGKIWAESEGAGKGSTFFVEIPSV